MTSDSSRIAQILKDALAAVDEADVPPELKATALEKAIDVLAGVAPGGTAAAERKEHDGGGRGTTPGGHRTGDVLDKIAETLKLDREVVEEVFHHDDTEGLRIVLGTGKFEVAKRAGTKQLALLLAAGRQAAGIEEWTPTKDILTVVKDFNRFDQANFAYTIKQMDHVFLFAGSSSSDRKVKVNRQGKEEAAALIRALTGGDGS
jgi:hypothetical protein